MGLGCIKQVNFRRQGANWTDSGLAKTLLLLRDLYDYDYLGETARGYDGMEN